MEKSPSNETSCHYFLFYLLPRFAAFISLPIVPPFPNLLHPLLLRFVASGRDSLELLIIDEILI